VSFSHHHCCCPCTCAGLPTTEFVTQVCSCPVCTNLLVNAGFDNPGTLDPWVPTNGAAQNTVRTHSGLFVNGVLQAGSAQLPPAVGGVMAGICQRVRVAPNHCYTLSFEALFDTGATGAGVASVIFNTNATTPPATPPNGQNIAIIANPDTTGRWATYTLVVQAPPSARTATICFENRSPNGNLFIDDVVFHLTGP
jgi:hypothetical protein